MRVELFMLIFYVPNRLVNLLDIPGTVQPIIPSPPACASIREVPTAVPFKSPNSDAAR